MTETNNPIKDRFYLVYASLLAIQKTIIQTQKIKIYHEYILIGSVLVFR